MYPTKWLIIPTLFDYLVFIFRTYKKIKQNYAVPRIFGGSVRQWPPN